jgi:two-component system chemotaxis sensor kinase CheA
MDELLAQFLIEGPDLVQQGSDALLALERRPDDRTLMDDAFRAIHTLKGSVGLFNFPAMAATLHAAEDVLSAVRSGVRAPDRTTIDALLSVLTQTERWLSQLEAGGGLADDAGDIARRLAEQLNASAAAPTQAVLSGVLPEWAMALRHVNPSSGALTAIRYTPFDGAYFSGDDPVNLMKAMPGLLDIRLGLRPTEAGAPYDPFACRLIIEAVATGTAAEAKSVFRLVSDQVEIAVLPATEAKVPDRVGEAEGQGVIRTLRIDAGRVERLASLVDDLVTARTALTSLSSLATTGLDPSAVAQALTAQSEGLDRLVSQMHQQVMALRMTSVAPLLRRFPRVARELAGSLGKDIDFVVEDNGVEADKKVIEGLFEPLTHLIRNAIDHGVEAPQARERAGKARKGAIRLTANAVAGQLELTLEDDGAGIDPAAIRVAARARGLLSAAALGSLDDAGAIDLIFMAGFSTARAVTDVSGRGVGMDAVKTAVQSLGGRIVLDSTPGLGTTVHLRLPLSLTLTKVLIVVSDREPYGVPMDSVLETLLVPADAVTVIRSGRAFNWRDQTVPLLSLGSLVGRDAETSDADLKVLVIRVGPDLVGVTVDAIQDRADVAVRPLDGLLAGMPGVSGTTLLGDGRVLMILDPEALVG